MKYRGYYEQWLILQDEAARDDLMEVYGAIRRAVSEHPSNQQLMVVDVPESGTCWLKKFTDKFPSIVAI